MKKIILSAIVVGLMFSLHAAQLNPFEAYLTGADGTPLANTTCTITPPPGQSFITAVGTNLVAAGTLTLTSDAAGRITNSLVPGAYKLYLAGFTAGVPFTIVSNSAVQNLAQAAGVPVVTFMNFTIAQFSDAGTMAYELTNNWTRNSYAGVTNAAGFAPATNTAAGILAALGYTPPTNSYAGLTNALNFKPATNNPVWVTNIWVSAVAGITNASGYVTNLTVTLTTNLLSYQSP